MKKSNLLILSMLSMFFLLSACGSVEENDAQTIQSSEAAIQESVQQEQGEVTASETAENITENKEFIIQGVPLDRTSERTVYSDITHLLNERYDLLNELLCEWISTVDSRDSISVNLPDDRETVMYRVKVADSWEYYEQKAENIYDDIYIQEAFTPCYLGNLYTEVDDKLYRAEADGFVWGIDESSIKIWEQQGDNRYVVTAKDQSETAPDVIFVIRKVENKDNKYEIIAEIGLYWE